MRLLAPIGVETVRQAGRATGGGRCPGGFCNAVAIGTHSLVSGMLRSDARTKGASDNSSPFSPAWLLGSSARDDFVNEALAAAGLPLLRFPARQAYTLAQPRDQLKVFLGPIAVRLTLRLRGGCDRAHWSASTTAQTRTQTRRTRRSSARSRRLLINDQVRRHRARCRSPTAGGSRGRSSVQGSGRRGRSPGG